MRCARENFKFNFDVKRACYTHPLQNAQSHLYLEGWCAGRSVICAEVISPNWMLRCALGLAYSGWKATVALLIIGQFGWLTGLFGP